MRWPRKGILIRLCIYLPIIGFLAWQAYEARCASEPQVIEREPPAKGLPAGVKKRVVTFPDGTEHEIPELTQEQAEQMLGHPIEFGGADAPSEPDEDEPAALPPEAPPKAPPEAEAKPAAPTGATYR